GHYLAQNRLDDLRRTVQEIKSYAAEFSGAWLAAGDLYLRAGDRDAAIREYREGAERDPKQSTFYLKRQVGLLLDTGRLGEASETNSRILKDNPKDVDARNFAAAILIEQGQPADALTQLQSVITDA